MRRMRRRVGKRRVGKRRKTVRRRRELLPPKGKCDKSHFWLRQGFYAVFAEVVSRMRIGVD